MDQSFSTNQQSLSENPNDSDDNSTTQESSVAASSSSNRSNTRRRNILAFAPQRMELYYYIYSHDIEDSDREEYKDILNMCIKSTDLMSPGTKIAQLFVDLMNYRQFYVTNDNLLNFVSMLLDPISNPELLIKTKYILNLYNKNSKETIIQNKVFNFIHALITEIYNNQCYELLNMIQNIVTQMVNPKVKIVKILHTGIVICLKVMTATVDYMNALEVSISSLNSQLQCTSNSENELTVASIIREKKKMFIICKNNFNRLYSNNFKYWCHFDDATNKLVNMRKQCILEMAYWLQKFSAMFTKDIEVYKDFILYLKNETEESILLELMKSILLLFNSEYFQEDVPKNVFKEFVKNVAPFCKCIFKNVAISAMKILTVAVSNNLSDIPPIFNYDKFNLTYDDDLDIAKANGLLITAQIRKKSNNDEFLFIKIFVQNISQYGLQNILHIMQYLIEATYDDNDELKSWQIIWDVLIKREVLTEYERKVLFFVAVELAYQINTGINTLRVDKTNEVVQEDIDNYNLNTIPIIHQLINVYQNEKDEMLGVFKLISLFSYDHLNDTSNFMDLEKLINILAKLFLDNDDEEYIEKLMESLGKLLVNNALIHLAKDLLKQYTLNAIETLVLSIENVDSLLDSESLFRHLYLVIKFLNWKEMFSYINLNILDHLTNSTDLSMVNIYISKVLCRKLIWEIKTMEFSKNDDELINSITKLTSDCADFVRYNWKLLTDDKNILKRFHSFIQISLVIINYFKIIVNGWNQNMKESFGEYQLWSNRVKFNNFTTIHNFFIEAVFKSNGKISDLEIMELFKSYIGLVEAQVLSVKDIKNIFLYYHIHNEQFHKFYVYLLKELREVNKNAVPYIIVMVLHYHANEIIKGSEENHLYALKMLAKHFVLNVIVNQFEIEAVIKYGIFLISNIDHTVGENLVCGLKYFVKNATARTRQQGFYYFWNLYKDKTHLKSNPALRMIIKILNN